MLGGNRVGMYSNPTIEKMIFKDAKEPWDIDELIAKAEAEIIPGYKSITDFN